jgi:hypothetical protein
MRKLFLLALLLSPAALAAQDDPMETHLYNVEFLTAVTADHPGQTLGLSGGAAGVMVNEEMASGRVTGEDLVSLIKMNVAEDSWEHVASQIVFSDGVLTVTNRKSVHDKIAQYLNYWRGFLGKMISIDAAILSVDPQLLARTRSAGDADRPAILPPDHFRSLLEAAREGKFAELVKSMRITAHPGQRVSLQDIAKQQYVRDYDVQIALASATLDPVPDLLATGAGIDVRPYLEPFANGITMEVRTDLADAEALEERKLKLTREMILASPLEAEPGKAAGLPRGPLAGLALEPRIQLPRVAHDRLRTMLTVRNRESAIVGSVFRKGRVLLFVLTPAIVAADEKPAPEPVFEEQRLLRLFDISPLTRGVQDWPGPRLDVPGRQAGGGGGVVAMSTGATFALAEPAVLMQAGDVASMIRTRIAPDTWGNKRNSIVATDRGTLIVRQKPDVLREIERFLTTILMARAQMITTETVVIGFKKGARAEWEREIAALAPGGYFVEAEKFDKLLEEAWKGQRIRIVDAAEITGFPQQRVHGVRTQEEAYLSDFEPQVASFASLQDPVVDTFVSGFVFDVRPHYVHGNEQISVDFRSSLVVGQLRDVDALGASTSPLQAVSGKVLKWNANVLCVKGKVSLVAIETVGKGNDAEDLAVFVRARQNVLK